MHERQYVDWFRVIADLNRCGVSTAEVARRLGIGRSTVIGWRAGAEPGYGDGDRLLALWSDTTGLARDTPPMAQPGDWRAFHGPR